MGLPSKIESKIRFTGLLKFRCPPVLATAVEAAASKSSVSPSEYMRGSIIERLRADGIEVQQMAGAA